MAVTRYRCTSCGNLTRFDVVVTRTTRSFHHFTVGGELTVEQEDVLAESIEEVSCRWCGTGKAVEVLDGEMAGAAAGGAAGEAEIQPSSTPVVDPPPAEARTPDPAGAGSP